MYLAFKGQNITKIWQEIKTANYFLVLVSMLSVLVAHVLRALRWQLLYRPMAYKVGFWSVYHAIIIAYLANLALPRFGEIARCSVINKTNKVPVFASIGTVITERLFDLASLLVIAVFMLVFQYQLVANFVYRFLWNGFIHKLSGINYQMIIGVTAVILIVLVTLSYFSRKHFGRKYLRMLVSFKQGFGAYQKLKSKSSFLLYTVLMWVFYLLSIYFAFSALTYTSNLPLSAAFTALVFSSFAMAAPVQGGLGVFHWMVAQALVLYGISFKDGLAYATLIHASQMLLILVLGTISILYAIAPKKK